MNLQDIKRLVRKAVKVGMRPIVIDGAPHYALTAPGPAHDGVVRFVDRFGVEWGAYPASIADDD